MDARSDAELIALAKELPSRTVRFDENGEPWTSQTNPRLRAEILRVYKKEIASGEAGYLLIATHQELIARLDALIAEMRAPEK